MLDAAIKNQQQEPGARALPRRAGPGRGAGPESPRSAARQTGGRLFLGCLLGLPSPAGAAAAGALLQCLRAGMTPLPGSHVHSRGIQQTRRAGPPRASGPMLEPFPSYARGVQSRVPTPLTYHEFIRNWFLDLKKMMCPPGTDSVSWEPPGNTHGRWGTSRPGSLTPADAVPPAPTPSQRAELPGLARGPLRASCSAGLRPPFP